MSLQNLIDYYKKIPLSGNEIERLTGRQPIVYSDLAKYKSLEQVVGNKKAVVIFMQTSSATNGHFISIGVDKLNNAFYFDPYALPFLRVQQLSTYDEKLPDYITPLLEDYAKRHGTTVQINDKDFQARSGGVADCGRHSSIATNLLPHMTLKALYNVYFTNQNPFLTGDNISVILTLMSLDNITKYYLQ